jgi:signal transduction histidine kinase/HAMP domain-containing protein
MTLRAKLLLAQLPLLTALVVVALVSSIQGARLASESDVVLRDNYRSVLAAQRMDLAQEGLDGAAVHHLLGNAEEARIRAARERPKFEEQLRLEENNITEPGEGAATRVLRKVWDTYQQQLAELLALAPGEPASQYYLGKFEPVARELGLRIDDILVINQDAIVRKSDQVERMAAEGRNLVTGVAVAAILVGLLGTGRLIRRMLVPLQALGDAARRLGEQDFDARARIEGQDEIARLAQEFDGMAERIQRYQRSTLGDLLQAQLAAQSAIDSLPDPILVFDLDAHLTIANDAASMLVGGRIDPDATDPLSAADPAARAIVARVRDHVLSGKGAYAPRGFDEAVRVPGPEGDRSLLARGAPVYDRELNVTGATIVLQDVTRLRRFDELKSDLVATVAHEFRTPLTSLRMAIHLSLEGAAGPLNEKQLDLLHAARLDCERLQAMVDDLLDLSRIEGGRIQIVPRPTPVGSLLGGARATHLAAAEQRALALVDEGANDLPDVLADPERLPLVLHNLIENALAHTPTGGRISLRALRHESGVRFEVEDTGPGIPPEHRSAVFDKFFRAPGAPAGGAGLGLFIAREIVRGHGGEIGVDEGAKGGSLIWFTLPVAPLRQA